ncbi:nuclease-related domain protein [Lyngbya aestuarii BL J]|uniref:Nuclease-related domain protein n=1 Tax=Lyngbya aestuarii BL J TaxID=1348334 RepID=U7QIH2_9CYAN|nr:nuclease-related domain-containing protein [Lyngbya aestuarii]ERT07067.1 nuclease-related domain protein [Lyngbya aestuarii BL J]
MKNNSNNKKAGEFVHQMSVQRRQKAIRFYLIALGFVGGVLLVFLIFDPLGLGFLLGLGGGIGAYYFWKKGQYWMRRSDQALVGAKAEQEVAVILQLLTGKNWQIEYNLPLKRWGDADVVLCSRQRNWYVIDVKSHKGRIVSKDNYLKRDNGRQIYDFSEGNLLSKVRGQAAEVRQLKQAKWVTPLLCFTQAQVKIDQNNINGVYIVEKTDLIRILEKLEG